MTSLLGSSGEKMVNQQLERAVAATATEVATDIAYLRDLIVNLFFVGAPGAADRSWALVDAGVSGAAGRIARAAAERFGEGSRPGAIVMTHGHFDHIGALKQLAERWDVPVYAHELELPYLSGRSAYPPPDPTVGGGAMAALSRLYPRGPIDLGPRLHTLPADGAVPAMPGWKWIHTPGHTAGHVSFFREEDRALIAGDAVVTTKQESMLAVLTQREEVHGPPAYYTTNWEEARESVQRLATLEPALLATGHGRPLRGEQMLRGLHVLAADFQRHAVPTRGRYVREPAITDANGVVAVPPPVPDRLPKILAGAGIAAAIAYTALRRRDSGSPRREK
ncbi:MAG TPA: MBL fold metallo-hydrolase [Gemmatimonadaceae bacterium]|nr:MBL fold metallo-hydrolase [Gemmatimonadaceae bacterium]